MFNLGRWKEHFNKAVLINGTSKEKHEINLTRNDTISAFLYTTQWKLFNCSVGTKNSDIASWFFKRFCDWNSLMYLIRGAFSFN
jgi:hypothetical protein